MGDIKNHQSAIKCLKFFSFLKENLVAGMKLKFVLQNGQS